MMLAHKPTYLYFQGNYSKSHIITFLKTNSIIKKS